MRSPVLKSAPIALLLLSSCAPLGLKNTHDSHAAALSHLEQASATIRPVEERAAHCLAAAQLALRDLDSKEKAASARTLYNRAAADLVTLLRGSRQGTLWNRPLALSNGTTTYQLRFAGRSREGHYDPAAFTSFTRADSVKMGSIENPNRSDGIGGALVGVRKTSPLEPFSPLVGTTAPVTAVLDFHGSQATLSLVDPTERSSATVTGRNHQLAADFSAPLAYYPQEPEFLNGLMGAIHVGKHMGITGLYQLQPYDPERIPLVFVHGLISTPRMWRNVINELQADPEIRRHYQCLVFAYPTGNPPAYSALRLREELEKYRARHPDARDMVMVGHSMGGLLTRMQTISVERNDWNVIGEDKAAAFFRRVKTGDLIDRCAIYQANPRIDRAVFVCTPHRGSRMAVGTLGEFAIKLIQLPVDIASAATTTLGSSVAIMTGNPNRVPNSIDGLSPNNPAFKLLDSRPIEVPHHSIIGDRGKGDTPESSDGVVEYWSSHLDSAASEKIVPGPHGACELPETIAELQRIFHLHLKQSQR